MPPVLDMVIFCDRKSRDVEAFAIIGGAIEVLLGMWCLLTSRPTRVAKMKLRKAELDFLGIGLREMLLIFGIFLMAIGALSILYGFK